MVINNEYHEQFSWGSPVSNVFNVDSLHLLCLPRLPHQYIDPNYAGGGYGEYFGEDAPGALDCHSPDSDWVLIGVYRQEFYQYIEQISKHLW